MPNVYPAPNMVEHFVKKLLIENQVNLFYGWNKYSKFNFKLLNRSMRDWYTQLAVARVGLRAIFETAAVTAGSW
jgi:hypothetical protein